MLEHDEITYIRAKEAWTTMSVFLFAACVFLMIAVNVIYAIKG